MTLPLAGITVLDFSTLLPGPLTTLILAEAGARVIKVERPGGEDMRGFPPHVEGTSAPFAVLNAGKESLVLDLKAPDAMECLRPLLTTCDVLVEQFRPGVMDRLGLGYETLSAANPRLIYCSITGYGQDGPRAGEAGHDLNYQAVTGLLSLAPSMPAALVADIAGGAMPAVMNILLALRQRDLTGRGSRLDIAMADAMFTFAWFALAEGAATGRYPGAHENLLAGGSPRYALYPTRDGRYLAVGALEQKFWMAFCEAIALAPALRDDRADPSATRAEVARLVAARDAGEWQAALASRDCCCTIVASLAEATSDPHFAARGLFGARAHLSSGSTLPGTPLPIGPHLRRDPQEVRTVPGLDED
ncbi:CaiB/BaiF CoA transferase family protein [Salinarimonas soli]|uniref:CoA transferase n=1 Tax=Salinarimonas soli TaxID=1638099 RepID=A0A5B2VPY0_9HYPH|nr:CoA transferase [Salinarimonas soli]KAA2241085.1 CoA transferase [Salinarimonas soli]